MIIESKDNIDFLKIRNAYLEHLVSLYREAYEKNKKPTGIKWGEVKDIICSHHDDDLLYDSGAGFGLLSSQTEQCYSSIEDVLQWVYNQAIRKNDVNLQNIIAHAISNQPALTCHWESFRPYAYPDPMSPMYQSAPKAPWGFKSIDEIVRT